jgi:hypothetical protein
VTGAAYHSPTDRPTRMSPPELILAHEKCRQAHHFAA